MFYFVFVRIKFNKLRTSIIVVHTWLNIYINKYIRLNIWLHRFHCSIVTFYLVHIFRVNHPYRPNLCLNSDLWGNDCKNLSFAIHLIPFYTSSHTDRKSVGIDMISGNDMTIWIYVEITVSLIFTHFVKTSFYIFFGVYLRALYTRRRVVAMEIWRTLAYQ